jgi:hypothetical protein
MSPQIVTGASTRCTLPSSTKISRAFRHNCLTSFYDMASPRLSCSICLSSSDIKNILNNIYLKVRNGNTEIATPARYELHSISHLDHNNILYCGLVPLASSRKICRLPSEYTKSSLLLTPLF